MAQIHYCAIEDINKSFFEEPSNQVTFRHNVKEVIRKGVGRQKTKNVVTMGENKLLYEHFISGVDNEYTIFVVAENSTMSAVVFDGYIAQVSKFYEMHKKDRKSLQNEMRQIRNLYNHPPQEPTQKQREQIHPFIRTQLKVRQVKGEVLDAIDMALERGERLESLVYSTEELAQQSSSFKQKAKELKTAFWMNNWKLVLILAVVIILLVILGVWGGCGIPAFQNCIALWNKIAPS